MDQYLIGKFICECRKKKNLTQKELADKLCITDRAVSKWERGAGLPDASIMVELSNILEITVNELLSGRKLNKNEEKSEYKNNLIRLKTENENNVRKLFIGEIILIIVSTIFLVTSVYIVNKEINEFFKVFLLITSILLFIITLIYGINVEFKVGYYECSKCHHKFKPRLLEFIFAFHIGYKRRLRCPKCKSIRYFKKAIFK